jgi:hypothetical protein
MLAATVVGAMPWLGVQLFQLPASLLEGELRQVQLVLWNHGKAPLPKGQLVMQTNHPMLCVGENNPLASAEQQEQQEQQQQQQQQQAGSARGIGAAGTMFLLQELEDLQPGACVQIPLWVRGHGNGQQTLRMLFRYRELPPATPPAPGAPRAPKLRERTVRSGFQMFVLPSISVQAFARPSYDKSGEYVLIVEATNLRQQSAIALHQIRYPPSCPTAASPALLTSVLRLF